MIRSETGTHLQFGCFQFSAAHACGENDVNAIRRRANAPPCRIVLNTPSTALSSSRYPLGTASSSVIPKCTGNTCTSDSEPPPVQMCHTRRRTCIKRASGSMSRGSTRYQSCTDVVRRQSCSPLSTRCDSASNCASVTSATPSSYADSGSSCSPNSTGCRSRVTWTTA